jgi:flavin-dependent dehydrogenase
VELRERCAILRFRAAPSRVIVRHEGGRLDARLLVVADGLHSKLRHAAGLDGGAPRRRRFGLRRHYALSPWSSLVEVYFGRGAEAYVTPVGPDRVDVALLHERGGPDGALSFDELLARFPELKDRLSAGAPLSSVRGAGPLAHVCRAQAADRVVLIGDAAGYVDAISGEGLSLAFVCAESLAKILPGALARGASRLALEPYEREFRRAYRRYALISRTLVGLARRPPLRRRIVRVLGRYPRTFDWIVGHLGI